MTIRKLHIGGQTAHSDWEIFDANEYDCVDHVGNANDLSRFEGHTFDALYSSHVVEHFDYNGEIIQVLKEWRRVLKPGGKIYASVPDLDVLCELFLRKDVLSADDRFMVMRMMFGGHIDQYDYHVAGLNYEFLAFFLMEAGFENIERVKSFGLFNDTSEMQFKGVPISLNMVAVNPAV